jgi:hypothetical protein
LQIHCAAETLRRNLQFDGAIKMLDGLKTWYNAPYDEKMTATRWFLFVGFLMIIGIVWTVIIKHLTD